MKEVALNQRSWNRIATGFLAFALAAMNATQTVAQPGLPAQPVPPPSPGVWMQPQLNVLTVQGARGLVTLGNTANGLTLPIGPTGPEFSRNNALQLSVKSDWPGHFGYRRVTVTARSAKPATSDRTLEFRFTARDWNLGSEVVSVRQKFLLEQGQSEANLPMLVPQLNEWHQCQWELYVDNVRDEEFAVMYVDMNNLSPNAGNNVADVAAIGVSLDQNEQYAASADVALAYGNTAASLVNVAPAALPTDWIGYTSLNLVIMPADELETLIDDHPKQAAALLRWVATGGNLWLIGAGARWQQLADVERLLSAHEERSGDGLQERTESASESAATTLPPEHNLPPRWRFAPLDARAMEPAEGALVLAGFPVDESLAVKRNSLGAAAPPPPGDRVADLAMGGVTPSVDPNSPKTSAAWFAVRGWGLGAIAGFKRNLHSPNDPSNQEATQVLAQSLLGPRQQWGGRFGSVPNDSNVDFNDWLIPGVGMAPVGSFQILITLFVIGIGPFTYWFLRRMRKLPMLVAIVPAAAICTTLALFAYGILIDGVATQVRGRSITLLDQRSGECAAWGRYSYYAGIAPSAGLVIPSDQAMFPIMPNWSAVFGLGGRRSMTERQVVWDDEQRLTRGWLASRTPTQYHALAARKSPKKLQLRPIAQGMRLTNQLGVELIGVAIHDHGGKFYWCEALPIDKGAIVAPVPQAEVASKIRRLFTENLPELPAGDDGRRNNSYYSHAVSDSVMEGRLSAINSPQVVGWGPGRYIAFTTTAIELTPGVVDADEQKSFHVIEGSW